METKAYAKINLTLEVPGRRPDGYHEIRTVLQTIDMADKLALELGSRLSVNSSLEELDGEDNLVWRAATSIRNASGTDQGAEIYLEKHIPVGMGLGGGSSDAAATLHALNVLWGLNLGDSDLQSIAAQLGSDVPFFLNGGTAVAEGHGELVTLLPPIPEKWLVLLCPIPAPADDSGVPTKTARLYSHITEDHYTDGARTRLLAESIENERVSEGLLFNVFEKVAPSAFDGFKEAYDSFAQAGAGSVHMSGTGPSLYTFASSKEETGPILNALNKMGFKAYGVSTIQPEPFVLDQQELKLH